MENRILLPEKSLIIYRLSLYFRWIEVCKRVNKLIIPIYHKHSQTQLVLDLNTGIGRVFEKGIQIRYYHSYKEAIMWEINSLKDRHRGKSFKD